MNKNKKNIKIRVALLVLAVALCVAAGMFLLRTPAVRARLLLSKMSTEEKIGQVILMDFRKWTTQEEADAFYAEQNEKNTDMAVSNEAAAPAEPEPKALVELNDEIREIISAYHIGNIILFGENCTDTKLVTRLTYQLQQAAKAGGDLPLLIGTDQEGGSVTRLGSGTCLSGSMAICQVRQPIIDGFIFEKTFCIELDQKLPARTSWVIKRLIRSSREVRASFLKIIPIQQVALSTLISKQ